MSVQLRYVQSPALNSVAMHPCRQQCPILRERNQVVDLGEPRHYLVEQGRFLVNALTCCTTIDNSLVSLLNSASVVLLVQSRHDRVRFKDFKVVVCVLGLKECCRQFLYTIGQQYDILDYSPPENVGEYWRVGVNLKSFVTQYSRCNSDKMFLCSSQ